MADNARQGRCRLYEMDKHDWLAMNTIAVYFRLLRGNGGKMHRSER
jgi:hypothetical protein